MMCCPALSSEHVLKSYEIFDNDQVYAQCGLACAKLAKVSDDHGLISGSFFAGIPGTVGGALFMNAGAFGSETWRHVEKVKWLHTNGQIQSYDKSHFDISYRHTASKFDGWFLGRFFSFKEPVKGRKPSRASGLKKSIPTHWYV